MSLKDRILHGTSNMESTSGAVAEANTPATGEEFEMTGEQFMEAFQAEVAQSFMDRLRDGKYEIDEGYGGDNLLERIMGGGSPLGPYQHGKSQFKGPKMSGARPAGASWEYNPVDVRPDMSHRNPAPKTSGIEKKSPTPQGVPVDVRPDTAKKMPKFKLRADSGMSPTKKGWPGHRMESHDVAGAAAVLSEGINDTAQAIFG